MKSVFKKLLCFAVIIAIAVSSIQINVSSYTALRYRDDPEVSRDPGLYLEEYVDTDALREALIPHFMAFEGWTDISEFNIPESMADSLCNFIWKEIPECFNVYGLGTSKSAGYIRNVYASYRYEDTYAGMLEECVAVAGRILDGIAGNNDLDDVQKALLLHDRLCVVCEYDYSFSKYNMYDALVTGSCVCEGYTAAYSYLLRRAGIKSFSCLSDALNHIWNLVNIDGTYYHTDVTWDDISWNYGERGLVGGMYHNYFLISNEKIAIDHGSDDYLKPAEDTRYDSYFWQNSNTEFVLANGEIYYFDNANKAIKTYGGQILTDVAGMWYAGAGSIWANNFSRLSTGGGKLLYSLPTAIWLYDPADGHTEQIYAPELEDFDSIYGFTYADGYLIMDINNCPYGNIERLRQLRVEYVIDEVPQTVVYGDCNGDGVVDGRDLIRLRKYLDNLDETSGESLYEISPYSDCNGDGEINGADVIRLRKYLAEYNDETGTSSVILGAV